MLHHHHSQPYIEAIDASRVRRRAVRTFRSHDLESLVRSAARGDDAAWAELVARFERHLTRVVRSQRVPPHIVEDVVQTTFIRLYENLPHLRDPKALPGWLDTTARRETLRAIRAMLRERPLDVGAIVELPAPAEVTETEDTTLRHELALALQTLPERQRMLLHMLSRPDEPSYEEISEKLDMPIGSIGPTRGRAFERLRGNHSLRAAAAAAAEDRCDGGNSHVPYWAGAMAA
jgi:RNA polymerase sigma factor (sigma-70 family)